LALAIRLQSAGIQTTLIEARDKPGGRAYVFEDDGFKFDAGPTVITDFQAGAGGDRLDLSELLNAVGYVDEGSNPWSAAASADGRHLAVTEWAARAVSVFDLACDAARIRAVAQ
jgi:phytoene dehydrogenase-like protein